jgi:hypothetical protein
LKVLLHKTNFKKKTDSQLQFYHQDALNLLNDTYYTPEICLFSPPHLISLAIIYIVGNLRLKDDTKLKDWFSNLNLNMNEVGDLVNKILDVYRFNLNINNINDIFLKIKY